MDGPILVPTDGSDPASAAVDHALDIAADNNSSVHMLYVANTNDPRAVDALYDEGEEIIDRARARAAGRGVTAVDRILQGEPRAVIPEYGATHDIEFLVMGAHGRHGIGEYLFGTTTEAVVPSSEVPVMTVRTTAEEGCSYPYERIVVPTDDSDHAQGAAELAATIAARNGATLHLLFVADKLPETIDPRSAELSENAEESALEVLTDVASQLDHDDVIPAVETGSVPHAICSYAEENDADLITMGTHGWSGFDRFLLGSFTERVIRTAPLPVLTTTVKMD